MLGSGIVSCRQADGRWQWSGVTHGARGTGAAELGGLWVDILYLLLVGPGYFALHE